MQACDMSIYCPCKSKIKLSRYRHVGCRGERHIAPTHSGPRHKMGRVVSVSPRPRFTPGERTSGTHWIGDWVGLRTGLYTQARGKTPLPLTGIEPRSPGLPVRSQTLYWATLASHWLCILHWILIYYHRKVQYILSLYARIDLRNECFPHNEHNGKTCYYQKLIYPT
jgi:hypothetical protein